MEPKVIDLGDVYSFDDEEEDHDVTNVNNYSTMRYDDSNSNIIDDNTVRLRYNNNYNNNNNAIVLNTTSKTDNDDDDNINVPIRTKSETNKTRHRKKQRQQQSTSNSLTIPNNPYYGLCTASVEIPVLLDTRLYQSLQKQDVHNDYNTIVESTLVLKTNNNQQQKTSNNSSSIVSKVKPTKVTVSSSEIPIFCYNKDNIVRIQCTSSYNSFGRTGYVTGDVVLKYNYYYTKLKNNNNNNTTTSTTSSSTKISKHQIGTSIGSRANSSMISIISGIRNIGLFNNIQQQQQQSQHPFTTTGSSLYNGYFVTMTLTEPINNNYNGSNSNNNNNNNIYTLRNIVHTKSISIHGNESIHISNTISCNIQECQSQQQQQQIDNTPHTSTGILPPMRVSIHTDCCINKPSSSSSSSFFGSYQNLHKLPAVVPRLNVRASVASNNSSSSTTTTTTAATKNTCANVKSITTTSSYLQSLLKMFNWNIIIGWSTPTTMTTNTSLLQSSYITYFWTFMSSPTFTIRLSPNVDTSRSNDCMKKISTDDTTTTTTSSSLSFDANCTYRLSSSSSSTTTSSTNQQQQQKKGNCGYRSSLWNFGLFWTRRYNNSKRSSNNNIIDTTGRTIQHNNNNNNNDVAAKKSPEQVFGIGIVWNYLPITVASFINPTTTTTTIDNNRNSSSSSNINQPTLTWIFTWTQGEYTIRVPITILIGLSLSTTTTTTSTFYSGCVVAFGLNLVSRLIHEVVYYTIHIPTIYRRQTIPTVTKEVPGKVVQQDLLQQRRVIAIRQQSLMEKNAIDKARKEDGKNGLVITKAIYCSHCINTTTEAYDDDDRDVKRFDVTIPLQFWVTNSRLELRTPFYDMLGFYDVTQEHFLSLSQTISEQQGQDIGSDTSTSNSSSSKRFVTNISSMISYFWFGRTSSNDYNLINNNNTDNNNGSNGTVRKSSVVQGQLDIWYKYNGLSYYYTISERSDENDPSSQLLLLPNDAATLTNL